MVNKYKVKISRTATYEIDPSDLYVYRDFYKSDKEFIKAIENAVKGVQRYTLGDFFDSMLPEDVYVRVDSIKKED